MSMFTLTISCLTTSNLPWFMALTFQYCYLQHQTLLPSIVTSTPGRCCCFHSIFPFFLELILSWSPVAYWASTDLGSSCFGVLSFCLFILFMGFSRQEYWSGLPFPFVVKLPPNPAKLHMINEIEDKEVKSNCEPLTLILITFPATFSVVLQWYIFAQAWS